MGPLATVLVLTLAVVGFAVVGLSFWIQREAEAAHEKAAAGARYPELEQTEVHARARLNHYRVIDDAAGVYQIPIERAIEVLARDTVPPEELTTEVRF